MNVFQLVGSFLIEGIDKAKSDIKSTSSTAKSEFKGMGEEGTKGSEKVSQGFGKSAKAANPLIEAIKKIGKAIATYMSIQAIKDFAQACVDAAAEVSAEASAFEQIMGDYSVEAQAKMQAVADATGVTNTRLTSSMTSMTAKFKGLGFGVEEATDLAARGLTIASDAAAFWDKSLEDAQSSLNSFINGSYEGGEAIGLFANDTQLAAYAIQEGIVATTAEWSALDEATKQATRLEYAENMMAMSGATGQAAKEADQYANVKANLTEKWRQFKAVIGEPLMQNVVIPAMEKLSGVVDTASAGFQEMTQWVSDNRDAISTAVGVVAAFATGLGVLAIVTNTTAIANGLLTAAYVAETAALNAAATAQAALNAIMNANPIGIIIALVSALVVAIVYFWNTSEEFRQFWIGLWEDLKATLQKAGEFFAMVGDAFIAKLADIKKWASDTWNGFTSSISGAVSTAQGKVSSLVSTVTDKFNAIKTAVTDKINGARDAVQSAINKIKSFFNFTWSLPKIKLPHFNITGNFSLNPPSIPKFSVSWYAKAMDEAMILSNPTIFGAMGGKLLGGGEAGPEVISGEAHLMGMFRQAVVDAVGAGITKEDMREAFTEALGAMVDLLQVNLVVNGRQLATATAGDVDSVSGSRQMLVGRGLTV